jgi:hypothetical protein
LNQRADRPQPLVALAAAMMASSNSVTATAPDAWLGRSAKSHHHPGEENAKDETILQPSSNNVLSTLYHAPHLALFFCCRRLGREGRVARRANRVLTSRIIFGAQTQSSGCSAMTAWTGHLCGLPLVMFSIMFCLVTFPVPALPSHLAHLTHLILNGMGVVSE